MTVSPLKKTASFHFWVKSGLLPNITTVLVTKHIFLAHYLDSNNQILKTFKS